MKTKYEREAKKKGKEKDKRRAFLLLLLAPVSLRQMLVSYHFPPASLTPLHSLNDDRHPVLGNSGGTLFLPKPHTSLYPLPENDSETRRR